MDIAIEDGREFWRAVLVAGGMTAVPRWTLEPVPGVADFDLPIADDLAAEVPRLADRLGVPASAVMVAAHAKVLAALTGEREVATGYAAGRRMLPFRVDTGVGSWRELVRDVARVESALQRHREFPVDELRRELGVAGPSFETEIDPAGSGGGLGAATVFRAELVLGAGNRLALRLRYRTDAVDAECAARVAGYHCRALELMVADADAEHARQSLLSADELRLQLDGLAGPRRELPDRRFHELFEERVRRNPDAVAAVHGDREWTYRELNARANRIGRALLARGLRRESVVAVVTERNLDWMAAVIAVFKAGGVYLPIEPHFPADRIATTLARAGCTLVLTEPASTMELDKALDGLPGIQRMLIDAASTEDHPDDDLGVAVTADQAAYIYFTSGSTGTPKGALCEHAGMLNHLHAKIGDLDIGEGDVVAQVAPQCFDISLWQLVSALLVGGRTVLIPQEVILDVARFVETIASRRVDVLQVVPSYLEVVLSYLEQHQVELAELRCVSVTGEALKAELAQRFFTVLPGAILVNAYGLTETSDDTNHEVMHEPPAGERVPLGPTVQNVRVYLLDEHLQPVPLGAPGVICFSGVCVGRGYVNDPERTRAVYLTDPHRPGQRLYKGGDYGRWRPDGKLEFLGRRDSQVKISGFRIELGEIDNTLLRVPGIRDGAVVVSERPIRGKQLVAFYSGPQPVDVELLRERLGASLPHYMIPAEFHWGERLPLTANGKIDTKALAALAAELDLAAAADGREAPVTPTEQRLAAAYARVLGVPVDEVGRRDHFFDLGGSSLLAVKLAVALKPEVSLTDVTRYPVLADLAELVESRAAHHPKRPALLQTLAEPLQAGAGACSVPGARSGASAGALVCFPYAGGNAVNFQPMARVLADTGLAVHAVELPGHDLAAEPEPFAPLPQVVEQVVTEIVGKGLTDVLLWGHSSGAAFAVATARRLQQRGVTVARLFLAAQLPRSAVERRAAATELAGRADAEIAAQLRADSGYSELGELDAQRSQHIGAAYRRDCIEAHRYLAALLDAPPAPLSAPVTVVTAADDPATAGAAERYRDWQFVAEHLDWSELPDGGHYFLRTRPAEAARTVLSTTLVRPDALTH
jgi:amino acid adenylation domain-containing protein